MKIFSLDRLKNISKNLSGKEFKKLVFCSVKIAIKGTIKLIPKNSNIVAPIINIIIKINLLRSNCFNIEYKLLRYDI